MSGLCHFHNQQTVAHRFSFSCASIPWSHQIRKPLEKRRLETFRAHEMMSGLCRNWQNACRKSGFVRRLSVRRWFLPGRRYLGFERGKSDALRRTSGSFAAYRCVRDHKKAAVLAEYTDLVGFFEIDPTDSFTVTVHPVHKRETQTVVSGSRFVYVGGLRSPPWRSIRQFLETAENNPKFAICRATMR